MTQTLTTARIDTAAPLDLDARLALSQLAMDERLDQAAVAFEVNTAHLPATPVDFGGPILPALAPQPVPAATPLADCLQRARGILAERGWCRWALRGEQGAVCPIGAIRAAATSRGQADDACALLLEAIQREFTDAATVPSWNDRQTGPRLPLRMLDQAANHAAARGI
ncbi:DUF6197 family protein [Streptomyces sp. NPDC002402]